jgi:ethylmalonyl-CoA/methylmalonyl-CoA decarboxylase
MWPHFNRTAAFPRVSARFLSHSRDFVSRVRGIGGGSVDLSTGDPYIATLTVNNVSARNALSGTMMAQFADAVATLQHEYKGVGVVIRGAGGNFCSGADLRLVNECLTTPQDGLDMCSHMQSVLSRFHDLPLVSLAVVEGYAVGGGSELATAADFRLFAPDAVIQFKHALMALSPGWGGGTRLTQLVGRRKALQLMGTTRPVPAPQALELGLADVVTESSAPKDIQAAIRAFFAPYVAVASKSSGAVAAVRAAKTIVAHAASGADRQSGLDNERAVFGTLWASTDNKQQVHATLEKLKRK